LSVSLLLSLLVHALVLSLSFGGQEFGLPGFTFPWEQRRAEVPDLLAELAAVSVTSPPASALPPAPMPPLASVQTPLAGPLIVTFSSPKAAPALPAPAVVSLSASAA
jgi:hypothetical protein